MAHEAGLQANVRIAHIAFDFRFGNKRGDGVHHNHIGGVGTHQQLADLEGLLTGVWLRNQHLFNIHPNATSPSGVQCMFGINERHHATGLLGFGGNGQGQRGLATGFWSKHFDNATFGNPSAPQGQVQAQRASSNPGRRGQAISLEAHDGALAVGLLDLVKSPVQRGLATGGFCVGGGSGVFFACCHG